MSLKINSILSETAFALRQLGILIKDPEEMLPVQRWYDANGKLWTNSRVKTLKVCALHILAGNRNQSMPSWVKYRWYRGFKIPNYPVFRYLIMAILNDNFRAIRLLLSVLNIYHLFRGQDEEKVLSSLQNIKTPFSLTEIKAQEAYNPLFESFARELGYRYKDRPIVPRPFSTKAALRPGVNGRYEGIIHRPRYPGILRSRVYKVVPPSDVERWADSQASPEDPWGGNLHVIHESGMKQRIIAIPCVWLQWSLDHLKKDLLGLLKGITEDNTFDQESTPRIISKMMVRGRRFHAVDLSSATDNFPQSWQRKLLEVWGVPMDLISAMFDSHFTYRGESYQYLRGQAMGLGPSFPLFALTHHALLRGLCRNLGLRPSSSYRILGDDIVIFNNDLAESYKLVLQTCNIPISVTKSITSTDLTEFAGKILYKGRDVTPIKWRNLSHANIEYSHVYTVLGVRPEVLFPGLSAHILALRLTPKWMGGFGRKLVFVKDHYIRGLVNQRVHNYLRTLTYVTGVPKVPLDEALPLKSKDWDGVDESLRVLDSLVTMQEPTDPRLIPVWNLGLLSPDPKQTINVLLENLDWEEAFQLSLSNQETKRFWGTRFISPRRFLAAMSNKADRIRDLLSKELIMSKDKKSRASREYVSRADIFKLPPGIYTLKQLDEQARKSGFLLSDYGMDQEIGKLQERILEDTKIRLVLSNDPEPKPKYNSIGLKLTR